LADEEGSAFFRRNPHLTSLYRNRLIAVALCQGAALQYLGVGYGINDFDVHYFYERNHVHPQLARRPKRTRATVGSFASVPVDFVRTVVPSCREPLASVVQRLRTFLTRRLTANAFHLAQKAVIGLSPRNVYGVVVWPDG
jgi:hypothetical protein